MFEWEDESMSSVNFLYLLVCYFLTFEKIKPVIKSNNFTRYYTIISNIPSDFKKCLKDNIDNINTENFHPKEYKVK
jgi:hypothetical protein